MIVGKYRLDVNEEKVSFLVREADAEYGAPELNRPDSIVDFMDQFNMRTAAEERMYMIGFNTKCRPLGVFELSVGSESMSIVNIKGILTRLLLIGACSFVLIHNHPSGNPKPSADDIKSTEGVKRAADIIGLNLLDHIIIGDTFFSLKQENYI